MTSLLGRLARLFPKSVRLEDLFTETIARLFETRPDLCVAWLQEAGLVDPPDAGEGAARPRIETQKTYAALAYHTEDSRPDLVIEVRRTPVAGVEPAAAAACVVMVESKIWSGERPGQLRRYAEHLNALSSFSGKTLAYVTRGYDSKDGAGLLDGLDQTIRFEQLRWRDFYRFLQNFEKDALTEEVMAFMEERGMAGTHRLSAEDLVALSGVPRAFEVFDDTLGDEVRLELEEFAGGGPSGGVEALLRRGDPRTPRRTGGLGGRPLSTSDRLETR